MCNTKLQKRTDEIIKRMFYRNTFDITLMDRYFSEKEVNIEMVFSLHSYVFKNIGTDTFIFSDVFDEEFKKIAEIFKSLYFTLFIVHTNSYNIDVMNLKNPIHFKDKFVQKAFKKWLK